MALCLCLSQVGVLSKLVDKSSWFLAWELPSIYPRIHCLVGKFWCFQKGYFPLDLFPKFWIKKISQRQVARVVNKTRQRSSSLTTFASVDASCLCTHIVYYTPVGVMLLLHYFDLYWICYTTSSTSCAGVSKISTDTARRAVRPAVAELLVSLAVTKIRFTIRG